MMLFHFFAQKLLPSKRNGGQISYILSLFVRKERFGAMGIHIPYISIYLYIYILYSLFSMGSTSELLRVSPNDSMVVP